MTQPILDLTLEQFTAELLTWGEPAYRGRQIWSGVFQRLAPDFASMTDLPGSLRDRLGAEFRVSQIEPGAETVTKDRLTRKVALRLLDGQVIETVLMRYRERNSVCVSTQVGCPAACVFCATGQGGFCRNLTAAEIVEQVLYFARALARFDRRVTNVVFMGMGEPFLNYDATWQAIEILSDPQGFGLGARHMTVSTVGVVPGIRRFTAQHSQVGLAVSLHAATNELRTRLVPMNRKYPLRQVIAACQDYAAETGRRVTFEYALIDGVNDRMTDARALSELLKGMTAHVNLIPLNPTPDSKLRPSPRPAVEAFRAYVASAGVPCTVRLGRGVEIQAACGQLRAKTRGTRPRKGERSTKP